MLQYPDLRSTLAPVLWARVGAVATRLYMPERMTQDLDILVLATDSRALQKKLSAAGFVLQGDLSTGGKTWVMPGGMSLDVLECDAGWCPEALMEAQGNLDPDGSPVLPLRFLVLMKYQASRARDVADITDMLGQAPPEELNRVRAVFQRWLPDDSEDLESLILMGQMEFQ